MTFVLQRSRSSFCINVFLHAVILLLLIVSALSLWLKFILAGASVYLAWHIHKQYVLMTGRDAVLALRQTQEAWLITLANGAELPVNWQTGSVVNAWFVALCWQHTDSQRYGYLYCPRDSLSDEQYRHLCRLLWLEKPEQ